MNTHAHASAQWVIYGFKNTLIYTSELISVSPFVFLVLRGTTFICTPTFSSPQFTN